MNGAVTLWPIKSHIYGGLRAVVARPAFTTCIEWIPLHQYLRAPVTASQFFREMLKFLAFCSSCSLYRVICMCLFPCFVFVFLCRSIPRLDLQQESIKERNVAKKGLKNFKVLKLCMHRFGLFWWIYCSYWKANTLGRTCINFVYSSWTELFYLLSELYRMQKAQNCIHACIKHLADKAEYLELTTSN